MSRGRTEVPGLLIALTSLLLLVAAAGKDCWRVGSYLHSCTHSASHLQSPLILACKKTVELPLGCTTV